MTGASIETTLELWASSLRNIKSRIGPLFTQDRVAASAGLFLDGLLGGERRKTGWMRAEAAGDPGPWRQQAVLGRGRWDANALRDVVELANAPTGAKGSIKVVYVGPEGGVRAKCDGAQMRQVLWNLVRNAIQSSDKSAAVTVRVLADQHEVTLSVDDQGPGVAGDAKARIFDSFYTTRSHGTGIGLAVVKRIIDDHARFDASIDVVSQPSGGASFRVMLSRDVAGLKASLPPPRPTKPASA